MTERTRPSWCPPVGDGPAYRWSIEFFCNGEYWSPQCLLLGGPPDSVDLDRLLRDWFAERGGPAATWRLQVAPAAEHAPPIAGVERWFEQRTRTGKSLRRDHSRPPAPPCWAQEDPAPAAPAPTSPAADTLASGQ
ncbi:MAG TPA: hypothetical protein VGL02_19795 [Streptomyces sp.]